MTQAETATKPDQTTEAPKPSAERYCLYARKSTESDEKQALSIDAQIKEMKQLAEKEGLVVAEVRQESYSAKSTAQRPIFNSVMDDVRQGTFDGILAWAPDRLSRNAGDLGSVVDLMDQGFLKEVRTYGQSFTNNPNEKFLLMILGSQAKLENDNKSQNVKRGLRARCEMGLWPSEAPTGYLNDKNRDNKCHIIVDPKRAPIIKQMFEKVAYEGWSGRDLYRWLRNDMNFKTRYGKHLTLGNVYRILNSSIYTGVFEYPGGSGNWYTGKHDPIISKELFDKVQEILRGNYVPKTESKEFAFTRLMKCGYCGSGVTADEKFKKLKDGTVNRHVYYFCTKSRDINCKNPYINEKKLIEELMRIIDTIDLDENAVLKRVKAEMERYKKFQKDVLNGGGKKQNEAEVDIYNYVKYLLKEGTILEKRELLYSLKTQLTLLDRRVYEKERHMVK